MAWWRGFWSALEGPSSSVVRGSSWLLEAGLVVGVMVVGLVGWPSPRVEIGRILDGPARQDRLSEEPVFGVQRRQCRISRRRARRGAAAGRWPRRGGPEPQLVRGRAHQRSSAELDRGRDHGGGTRRDAVDPGEVFGALVRRRHGVECDLVLLSVVGLSGPLAVVGFVVAPVPPTGPGLRRSSGSGDCGTPGAGSLTRGWSIGFRRWAGLRLHGLGSGWSHPAPPESFARAHALLV